MINNFFLNNQNDISNLNKYLYSISRNFVEVTLDNFIIYIYIKYYIILK